MNVLPVLVLAVIVLASGCTQTTINRDAIRAETACVFTCKLALQHGQDLSTGPCLEGNMPDKWVCDVAHSPRTQADNEPANQCPEFGKSAEHFVEVDEYCDLIRSV